MSSTNWTDYSAIYSEEEPKPVRHFTKPDDIKEQKASIIRRAFSMEWELAETKRMINLACVRFCEDVIARSKPGVRFIEWDFNDRGSLIRITYEVELINIELESVGKEQKTEYVAFEELAQYMD